MERWNNGMVGEEILSYLNQYSSLPVFHPSNEERPLWQ